MAKKKKVAPKRTRPNPGVQRAIEIAGTQRELARLMDVEQPAVHHWLYVNCPPERAREIEMVVGVPRAEICPEVFG